jgi:hypothetical protein
MGIIAVLLGGCSSSRTAEPPDPVSQAPAPAASFDASLAVSPEAIRVSYTFTNNGSSDLLVLNKVPSYDDSGRDLADPNAVYVTGRAGDQVVVLSKRAFPMPETDRKTWAQAPRLSGTVVASGASVTEQIVVPRPFKRLHPYGNDIGYGEIKLPGQPTEVLFCLGVLPSASQTTVQHMAVTTTAQYVFCSKPAKL